MLNIIRDAFFSWLWLFGAPIKDANILWIIIPIYVSWFFTEFFQEKKGTGFGNAITNGAVCIWVAIDWFRHITNGLTDGLIDTDYTLYVKYGFSAFILIFGIIVIIKGLQRKKFAHFGGRIRVITYILVMFTPIIYETAEINVMNVVPIFVFSPIYYLLLELIVFIVPDSKALEEDKSEDKPKPTEDPFKKPESSYKADFNSVSGDVSNPFDTNKDLPNKENLTSGNAFNSEQNEKRANPFENPKPFMANNKIPQDNQPKQTNDEIIENDNPFDEPLFPENNQPQPEQPNNETQPQQNSQEITQEYREPNFDELPNNNEEIWEKIKRKNQL